MPLTVPDQTIPAQIKVPDTLNTLSSIMNIKNQQQQLEAGQIANASNQANLTEKTALRDLVNNKMVQNPDGSVNPDKYAGAAIGVAPTLGATTAQGGLANQSTQISNATNRFKLQGEQFAKSMQFAGGLVQDPAVVAASDPAIASDPEKSAQASQGIMQSLSTAEDQMVASGIPKLTAKAMLAPLYGAAFHSPAQVRPMLANIIKQGMGAQGQATQELIPASGRQTPTIDNVGNPAVASKDQFGNVKPLQGQPVQGSDTPMPTGALPPGQREKIPALAQETLTAKNAMMSAPVLHETNQGILREIDNVSATGQVGPAFQKMNSTLGGVLDWSSKEKAASSYDLVGKYLERNALTAAASMGPQTNAGLEAQIKANGSLGYNPTAIKAITKLNDAIVSGSEAYYPGLQTAIKANPQHGVLAKEQFDQQWASVFTPTVMQLYNAAKSGDNSEVATIVKQHGGQGSAGVQDLIRRAQGIESLMKNGRL